MSFPQKSKFLKRAVGWKNIGEPDVACSSWWPVIHKPCGSQIHIGKDTSEQVGEPDMISKDPDVVLFKYCPRCMVKVV